MTTTRQIRGVYGHADPKMASAVTSSHQVGKDPTTACITPSQPQGFMGAFSER